MEGAVAVRVGEGAAVAVPVGSGAGVSVAVGRAVAARVALAVGSAGVENRRNRRRARRWRRHRRWRRGCRQGLALHRGFLSGGRCPCFRQTQRGRARRRGPRRRRPVSRCGPRNQAELFGERGRRKKAVARVALEDEGLKTLPHVRLERGRLVFREQGFHLEEAIERSVARGDRADRVFGDRESRDDLEVPGRRVERHEPREAQIPDGQRILAHAVIGLRRTPDSEPRGFPPAVPARPRHRATAPARRPSARLRERICLPHAGSALSSVPYSISNLRTKGANAGPRPRIREEGFPPAGTARLSRESGRCRVGRPCSDGPACRAAVLVFRAR